jgi:rod shape-determining protein MreB
MLENLLRRFSADLAIDLGTAVTRIAAAGEGVVLEEPSVVAVEQGSRRVLARGAAVGHLARQIEGRTPGSISVVRPLRDGVIADFELCEAMLRHLMRKAQRPGIRLPPRVLVGLPGGITPVERRAVFNSATRAGARQVWAMNKVKAAAIGAGLPLGEPLASLVCDIGAGTTEVAVLSLGDIVATRSVRIGGDAFDQAIVDDLRRRHQLRIGLPTAERLRWEIGSAVAGADRSADVGGCDANGLPRKQAVSAAELHAALTEPLLRILESVKETIDGCSGELGADLADRGLTLCGGGSLLHGMDQYLSQGTGIPVHRAAEPLTAVARGLLVCAEQLDAWKPALISADDED